jgi:hypothetical protein
MKPRKNKVRPDHAGMTFENLVETIRLADRDTAAQAGRAVNIALTLRNWFIGGYISMYELHGADRAKYGDRLFDVLAVRLTSLGVRTCGRRQLYQYLRFHQVYPRIVRSLTAQLGALVTSDQGGTGVAEWETGDQWDLCDNAGRMRTARPAPA